MIYSRIPMETPVQLLEIETHSIVNLIRRPNRFLGIIEDPDLSDGSEAKAHVHDPGRLQELLYPGNRVLVRRASNPNRKTQWDVIAARFNDEWILINSSFHRPIVEKLLETPQLIGLPDLESYKAEVKLGDSRLDFAGFTARKEPFAIETKGCTLAISGVGLFPDAPTQRGARHLDNLIQLHKQRYITFVIILLFRPDAMAFAPYTPRDPHFSNRFYAALEAGVTVLPLLMRFDGKHVSYLKTIPVLQERKS